MVRENLRGRPMTTSVSGAEAPVDKRFIGHPLGLMFLVLGEGFERFAYYGTSSILALFLTKQLLLPGHAEHVVGLGVLKTLLGAGGALTVVAFATLLVGRYGFMCYVTPLAGGWVADRWLGRSRTIALGAILMLIGYGLMAFEASFVAAIALILLGVGCFKGNIAAQIGDLYSADDLRRSSGFQLFTLSIQAGSIFAPIVCGGLAAAYGWKYGFFAAGASMALGLATLTFGQPWLPKPALPQKAGGEARPRLTRRDWIVIAVLAGMVPALSLSAVGNMQIFNTYLIWGDQHYNLVFFGKTMPAAWLVSLDAIVSVGCLIAVLAFWRLWAQFWREPEDLTKMIIGCLISATAPLLLAAASVQEAATGQKIGLMWGVAFHVVNDIGFVNIYGVGMALFTRAAPKSLSAVMIAIYYFYLAFGNELAGRLGGLLETLGPVKFWMLHAALCAAGAVMLLVFGLVFGRLLRPDDEAEMVAEPAAA